MEWRAPLCSKEMPARLSRASGGDASGDDDGDGGDDDDDQDHPPSCRQGRELILCAWRLAFAGLLFLFLHAPSSRPLWAFFFLSFFFVFTCFLLGSRQWTGGWIDDDDGGAAAASASASTTAALGALLYPNIAGQTFSSLMCPGLRICCEPGCSLARPYRIAWCAVRWHRYPEKQKGKGKKRLWHLFFGGSQPVWLDVCDRFRARSAAMPMLIIEPGEGGGRCVDGWIYTYVPVRVVFFFFSKKKK